MEVLGLVSVPLWLLALPLTTVLLVVYIKWHHGIFRRLSIPGPDPGLLGLLSQYSKKGLFGVDCDLLKQYGRVVGVFHGRRPWLAVADPELVKQICIKDFASFTNRYNPLPLTEDIMNGLTLIEDDHWHFSRSILSPGFSSGKMRQMVSLIQQNAENLRHNIADKSAKKESIDLKELFGAFTMDVIASTGFGIIIDSQKNPNDPFVDNARRVMNFKFGFLVLLNALFPGVAEIMHILGLRFFDEKAVQFFYDVGRKAMKGRSEEDKKRPDLLQLMLNSRKGSSGGATGKWDEKKFKEEGVTYLRQCVEPSLPGCCCLGDPEEVPSCHQVQPAVRQGGEAEGLRGPSRHGGVHFCLRHAPRPRAIPGPRNIQPRQVPAGEPPGHS